MLKLSIASHETDKLSLNAEISTKCTDISMLNLEIEDELQDIYELRREVEVLKEDHAAQIELLRTQKRMTSHLHKTVAFSMNANEDRSAAQSYE